MQMAKIMATEGYKEAGYQYVIIDDCWLSNDRAPDGKLQPHNVQFPNGMKYLADHVCFWFSNRTFLLVFKIFVNLSFFNAKCT